MPLRLHHDVGTSVSLFSGETLLFTLDYGSRPKPYIHPLCTTQGQVLTNFEPSDHVWHRGLWFTFKFVNQENFWEEPLNAAEPRGSLVVSEPPVISHPASDTVRFDLKVDWVRPNGEIVIDEHRTIVYRALSPNAYVLDHISFVTPRTDVLLDRTPFTTWGGYGGLCFRATRNWINSNIQLSTGENTLRPVGVPARWAVLSGLLDGGPTLTGSLAIIDHPSNPRHPTPFYGSANNPNHYLTPAPLFHEPMPLKAGASLKLSYRVVPHLGLMTPGELDALANDFARA